MNEQTPAAGASELSETALPVDQHRSLQQFVGKWTGTTRTWFTPGELADESETMGEFRTVLGGRFLRYEYSGSLVGNRMDGLAHIGFNTLLKRFEMTWMDTCHNGHATMFLTGDGLGEGTGVVGSYPDPTGGPDWGWRIELIVTGQDEMQVRMYNATPAGEEALGVETRYRRAL